MRASTGKKKQSRRANAEPPHKSAPKAPKVRDLDDKDLEQISGGASDIYAKLGDIKGD
jgi:hypothetical protein